MIKWSFGPWGSARWAQRLGGSVPGEVPGDPPEREVETLHRLLDVDAVVDEGELAWERACKVRCSDEHDTDDGDDPPKVLFKRSL